MNRRNRNRPVEKTDVYFLAQQVTTFIRYYSSLKCPEDEQIEVETEDDVYSEIINGDDIITLYRKIPGHFAVEDDPIALTETQNLIAFCKERILRECLERLICRLRNEYGIGWRVHVQQLETIRSYGYGC